MGNRCLVCGKTIRLPAGTAGKKIKCSRCSSILRIGVDDAGVLRLEEVVGRGDGQATTVDTSAAAGAADGTAGGLEPVRRAGGRSRRRQAAAENRGTRIQDASKVILIVALLNLAFGWIVGFIDSRKVSSWRAELSSYDTDEVLIDGEGYPIGAGNLIAELDAFVLWNWCLLLGPPLLLLVCYLWSRSSPAVAFASAIAVQVLALAAFAWRDPSALRGRILIKEIAIIGALVVGFRAATGTDRGSRRARLLEGSRPRRRPGSPASRRVG